MTTKNQGKAQGSPKLDAILKWEGRYIPMFPQSGGWRLRSRSKSFPVDFFFPTPSLPEAKRLAKIKLAAIPAQPEKSRGTLEDVAQLYLSAPKRCNADSANGNVSRLRSVVRDAFNQTLDQVALDRLSVLWPAYVAAKQGLSSPDYSTRRRENHAITSAMKQASSVFLPALHPYYRRQGVSLPSDAITIMWPAVSALERSEAKDGALITAWHALRQSDPAMWVVVGLARFAGLRQSEILACRGKWIRRAGTLAYVDLKDRPLDGYYHKTGRSYSAMILNPELVDYLAAIPADSPVVVRHDVERWIQRAPQAWLKPYTGSAKAPLHRLRGLYADHVRRETESAILARQEATKTASESLGHTSIKTTEDHYFSVF